VVTVIDKFMLPANDPTSV